MGRCSVVVGWPLSASKASVGSAGPLRRQTARSCINQAEVFVRGTRVLTASASPAHLACAAEVLLGTVYLLPPPRAHWAGASGIAGAEAGGGWAACAVAIHYRYRAGSWGPSQTSASPGRGSALSIVSRLPGWNRRTPVLSIQRRPRCAACEPATLSGRSAPALVALRRLLRLACLLEFRLRLKEFTCLGEKIQRDSTVAWLLHVASHVTSYLGKLRPTKVSCQFMSVSSWKHPRPALMAPWLARDILITTRFAQEDDCTIAADPPFFCRVLGTGEKLPGYHPG